MPSRYFFAYPRLLFLVDGLGALLSTFLLLVVAYFENVFGMQKSVLYQLLPVTTLFTVYSLGLYFLNVTNWQRYLAAIAIANILYSCLTMVLLFFYRDKLTKLGIAYFLAEIAIIVILSLIELRLAVYKTSE